MDFTTYKVGATRCEIVNPAETKEPVEEIHGLSGKNVCMSEAWLIYRVFQKAYTTWKSPFCVSSGKRIYILSIWIEWQGVELD